MKQEEPMDLWVYEREAFDAGIKLVCGVDEAGRGPLAGPVCAAAVILPPGLEIPGLNDSKKLTDKKRRELYDIMIEQAVSYGIAFASEQEIDEINILQATFLAMERAMQKLSPQPELALIDGNRTKDFGLPVRTIVKGDSLSASIAAASILAKVTRDRLMEEYDAQYPQYGFAVQQDAEPVESAPGGQGHARVSCGQAVVVKGQNGFCICLADDGESYLHPGAVLHQIPSV